jgi:hypothetical protein
LGSGIEAETWTGQPSALPGILDKYNIGIPDIPIEKYCEKCGARRSVVS